MVLNNKSTPINFTCLKRHLSHSKVLVYLSLLLHQYIKICFKLHLNIKIQMQQKKLG